MKKLEVEMQTQNIKLGAMIIGALCLMGSVVAQHKVAKSKETPVSKTVQEMRRTADTYARALATVAQGRAIATGKYNTNIADYAKYLGGSIPENPCIASGPGYIMVLSNQGQTLTVAAMAGSKCGKWAPHQYRLTL